MNKSRAIASSFIRLVLLNLVVLAWLYLVPLLALRDLQLDPGLDFGLTMLAVLLTMAGLVGAGWLGAKKMEDFKGLQIVGGLILSILTMVALVKLFNIDLATRYQVNFAGLDKTTRLEITSSPPSQRLIKTITNPAIIKATAAFAEANKTSWLVSFFEPNYRFASLKITFYAEAKEIANLGVGSDTLTTGSDYYKYSSPDEIAYIRKLVGL